MPTGDGTPRTYTISTETGNGIVAQGKLHDEIEADAGIGPTTVSVFPNIAGDTMDVFMSAALSAPEITAIDAVVLAHDGVPLVEPGEKLGITATFEGDVFDNGSQAGPTYDIDWNNGQKQTITLTGNITTLTFMNPQGHGNFMLRIIQGGAGSFTIAWPARVRWTGSTPPTLITTVGGIDWASWIWDGPTDDNWDGVLSPNFG